MIKATFVNATYEESISFPHQGNRASIAPYLKKGYRAVQDRNGFWVLTKPVSIEVYLKNSNNQTFSFNMKEDILKHYGKTRISRKLFDKFVLDSTSGKIQFYMDDNGYCFK